MLSLWCTIVDFLRQAKAEGLTFRDKISFSFYTDKFCLHADANSYAMSLLTHHCTQNGITLFTGSLYQPNIVFEMV